MDSIPPINEIADKPFPKLRSVQVTVYHTDAGLISVVESAKSAVKVEKKAERVGATVRVRAK